MRVGVIGGGLMGSGIAEVCARFGCTERELLADLDDRRLVVGADVQPAPTGPKTPEGVDGVEDEGASDLGIGMALHHQSRDLELPTSEGLDSSAVWPGGPMSPNRLDTLTTWLPGEASNVGSSSRVNATGARKLSQIGLGLYGS